MTFLESTKVKEEKKEGKIIGSEFENRFDQGEQLNGIVNPSLYTLNLSDNSINVKYFNEKRDYPLQQKITFYLSQK